ncbi:MAG: signal peptidase I [Candidatus Bathyarchaeota archaeon]|nr:signal peptidase I [Candidatus Bathyarchaeota archaeon]
MLDRDYGSAVFGAVCVSLAVGFLLYWIMLINVLPRSLNPAASSMLPIISAAVGSSIGGLLIIGVWSLRDYFISKPLEVSSIKLRRDRSGRVLHISSFGGRGAVVRRGVIPHPRASGRRRLLGALEIGLTVAIVLGAYLLVALYLGVSTPLLVVSSPSMVPALNVGDIAIIVGADPSSIRVGDIIAFNLPEPYSSIMPSPVIHKVSKVIRENGAVSFRTARENPPGVDPWTIPAEYVIGRCVAKIPYVGLIALFIKTPMGIALLASILIAWILYSRIKGGR